MATPLGPYNTIALAASTPQQLTGPNGHWNLTLFNSSAGAIYVSNSNTAGANATSFDLPPNLSVTITIWGPTGVWVSSGAATGTVSALLQPRGA
jgi:hypothetical protein